MTLDELIPLSTYNERNKLTYRESLAKALEEKLEIFYVFDEHTEVIYVPLEEYENGSITDKTDIESPNAFTEIYKICDFTFLTPDVIRALWRASNNDNYKVFVEEFFEIIKPDVLEVARFYRDTDSGITIDNLFVAANQDIQKPVQTVIVDDKDKISNTALKVIGLLMKYLAKSPKYASGSSPNKSQIKELLLDLAEEQGINTYGLSKVDERLLAEAMKYLETQKL